MITISDLALQYSGTFLFQHVDLQFTAGNCYGVIGANGAGKSTFLKLLSGELDSTKGTISIKPGLRMSVLKQDQFRYDAYTILDTVIMGNQRLYDIMKQKDALYAKPDFSDEDGLLASELETEFAELNGWEAESDASRILQGLGVPVELHNDRMADTDGRVKVKVLLAQALFGQPDIILLDEPTNNLDIESINWLENFILDYEDNGLVIVVSHDRHFLNTVCTHIVDIDYGKIRMYVGNYDFWYESSQLMQNLIRSKNKRNEEKIAELRPDVTIIDEQPADSKTDKAMNLVEDWLQRFSADGINAIVCQSAMTVQGVVEALRAHNLLGKIYVAAQDFTQPSGTEWLETGATYVDVFYDYNALAKGVYDTILDHEKNGTDLPEQVMINPSVWTKENASEFGK